MKDLGYKFFTVGDYNLNIIGIRNNTMNTNTFNDELHVIFKIKGIWVDHCYQITTEPGFKTLQSLEYNKNGCAILVPGQYNGVYQIGKHNNKYTALIQTGGKVKVYRDSNRDKVVDLDPATIENGYFGINIHKAGTDSTYVDGWSAGCQVFKRSNDFDKFMKLVSKSATLFGNKFTYTLLTDWD
jgi:hypothetical protein